MRVGVWVRVNTGDRGNDRWLSAVTVWQKNPEVEFDGYVDEEEAGS